MSGPALDPELLKAFLAVADQLSFTRAARSLNRTQSAVSSQIKRLETQLGTELFKRSTTNVALSAAGEGLVGYARRILMLGDEAVQRLKQHRMEGRVRLGVMDDYGALILPPILKSFSNLYPGIELQMETGLTSGMVGRLGRATTSSLLCTKLASKRGSSCGASRLSGPARPQSTQRISIRFRSRFIRQDVCSESGPWMPSIVQGATGGLLSSVTASPRWRRSPIRAWPSRS
jgi:Bacterial regulatory helix-turn-helix protein, lysR family/LysR substrate binding domain